MKTSTFEIKISAPVQTVWCAISTTEGVESWGGSLKIDSNWELGSPIVITCYDDKGEIVEHDGGKMIFNGIIEVKNENKEITFSYTGKAAGLEKERYVLEEVDANTTRVSFTQTYNSEEKAKDGMEAQKEIMGMLKNKLEEEI
ncbi:MAG: SRPBCC domain-containing protein [Bdellovibrionales bacterium]